MNKREEQFIDKLGKNVAQKRKQFGLTQKTLSQISGVDEIAISYIENGKRKAGVITLFRLATAMGIKVEELFHNN